MYAPGFIHAPRWRSTIVYSYTPAFTDMHRACCQTIPLKKVSCTTIPDIASFHRDRSVPTIDRFPSKSCDLDAVGPLELCNPEMTWTAVTPRPSSCSNVQLPQSCLHGILPRWINNVHDAWTYGIDPINVENCPCGSIKSPISISLADLSNVSTPSGEVYGLCRERA